MTVLDHDYQKIIKINQDDIIMDVGAAEGLFSMSIIDKVRYIIMIEPNPDYFSKLQKTFNNIPKITLVNKGTWNKIEKRKIKLEGWESNILQFPSNLSPTVEIETDTIDNIVFKSGFNKIDFMKMDIEGAEIEALQGADYVLNNTNRIVVAAYHSRFDLLLSHTCYLVENYLIKKGFQTKITEDKLVHGWRL